MKPMLQMALKAVCVVNGVARVSKTYWRCPRTSKAVPVEHNRVASDHVATQLRDDPRRPQYALHGSSGLSAWETWKKRKSRQSFVHHCHQSLRSPESG